MFSGPFAPKWKANGARKVKCLPNSQPWKCAPLSPEAGAEGSPACRCWCCFYCFHALIIQCRQSNWSCSEFRKQSCLDSLDSSPKYDKDFEKQNRKRTGKYYTSKIIARSDRLFASCSLLFPLISCLHSGEEAFRARQLSEESCSHETTWKVKEGYFGGFWGEEGLRSHMEGSSQRGEDWTQARPATVEPSGVPGRRECWGATERRGPPLSVKPNHKQKDDVTTGWKQSTVGPWATKVWTVGSTFT